VAAKILPDESHVPKFNFHDLLAPAPRFKSSAERRTHRYYCFLRVDWNYVAAKLLPDESHVLKFNFHGLLAPARSSRVLPRAALIGITSSKQSTGNTGSLKSSQ
jgi:hypothetical protein